ncbi:MAG: aminopeptidase N [Woeseiaceae bacterium]
MTDTSKKETAPKTVLLKDYQPPRYLLESVSLDFELFETKTQVRTKLKFSKNNNNNESDQSLLLNGQNLELKSLKLNGKKLSNSDYTLNEEGLLINECPDDFTLEIHNEINPLENKALEGLYLSSGMYCTQCEAEGFRRITYFPDRPDVMSKYEVTLHADKIKYPQLLSNGNLIAKGEDEGGRHWATWQDPSLKPSYLFALVAGDLHCQEDSYTTISGRNVSLQVFVEHENSHKCDHALASLKQAMKWDEDVYGREYDLDVYMIVAVNDFNMGAMENKGLNIFNSSCVLASPETATDADFYNIQSIIAHEYFHNWSGNRVTCRDWFQLSLKEGFTVFRDQEFSADLNSRATKRIDDVNVLRTHQFAQDSGPMAHPIRPDHYIEISNFYTVTVYNKGAEIVRMIKNIVGAEGFRSGTDLYFNRHDGQAVTTEDFVAAIEDATKVDLSLFKNWYSQAGTPVLDIETQYDNSEKIFSLTIKQSCADTVGQTNKKSFHIPLQMGLINSDGDDIELIIQGETSTNVKNMTLALTKEKQTFVFSDVKSKPILSLNRNFTSPVKINSEQSDEELTFLFANDSNAFNRWEAGQTLAINVLLSLVSDIQKNKKLGLDDSVLQAYKNTLCHPTLDQALIAQAMTLPSESYLADQCETVDVDAIHKARTFMKKAIAQSLKNEFKTVYDACENNKTYSFNAKDMAMRDLKSLCLSYLMCLQGKETIENSLTTIKSATNMTDVLSALSSLSQYDIPERHAALEQFYEKWKHDAQVVEKWFAIQATADFPNVLDKINTLMQHEAFSITNPNKVRSLIGRFCAGNIVHFHNITGSGYTFLADQVLTLDAMNPQIAARLVQNFSRWRRYDEMRQQLMKQQLERIIKEEGLSKDVFEIVSRSLND